MSHLSRRTLVAGAATLPALAGTAARAITPDPIFAAIERFRAANEALSAACQNEPDNRSPEYRGWSSRQGTAAKAEQDALMEMIEVRPTTKAGAVALINVYLENYRDDPAEADEVLELIGQAIPHLV
jgi:hypothetical protein